MGGVRIWRVLVGGSGGLGCGCGASGKRVVVLGRGVVYWWVAGGLRAIVAGCLMCVRFLGVIVPAGLMGCVVRITPGGGWVSRWMPRCAITG